MGVLHQAVSYERNDMVDLVLMSELADINLMSPQHGTPLHIASKIGNNANHNSDVTYPP